MLVSPGKWKKTLLLLVLSVLPVFLIVLSVKTEGETWLLARTVSALLSPVQESFSALIDGAEKFWRGYIYLSGSSLQNFTLQREIEGLKAERSQLQELKNENNRLRSLLEYRKKNQGHSMKLARVISFSLSPQSDMLSIDLGTSDGVQKGMAVVSVDGLVGRVFRVFKNHSDVLLMTDRNSAIAGIDQTSRARGIVRGRGMSRSAACDLEYIPRSEIVNDRDTIVTAGMGEFFPKGITMGSVHVIDRTANYLFQKAEVTPVVKFSTLEEVLVVYRPSVDDVEPPAK
jgi:rod shape-determining protein MreC